MSFGFSANNGTLQPFTKLLLHIGSHMSDIEVSAVKLVLSIEPETNLKTKALLNVNNAFDVLMLMVNRGYIAETDLSFLEDIFTNLFRKDLVSDIREYMNHTDCNSVSGTIPKTSAGNAEGRITDDEKAENIPTIGGLELETTKTIDESNADICAEDVSIDSVHSATNISDEDKQTAAMGSQPPLRKNSWKYEEKSSNRKRISTSLFISYEQIKHGFGVLQSTSNSV